ncbi:palmitoyltransferase ZDHHC11 isoform X2 [Paramormyrops kingsleyae]|uniref:Palmitoyltransferase n=1 Tax=Paramormyrops kingsleyae TaxID=1676925 RepID=A0A3B3Q2Q2_9TELE|nr:probable palmitoyltransferase ZDHHC11 isoform X2 [Paramormyrops kingsleyae]
MLGKIKMNAFARRLRRTAPSSGDCHNELVTPPAHSRVNGWSLPLHSFQLIGWLVYSYMAVVAFGIYIPLLPPPWASAVYAVVGITFLFHLVAHLLAVSIDPADPSVRARKNYSLPMPVLDRKKHPHVIQNLHCHLCEVDVGSRVKHCSNCNKCIADFDHHCKWLNNCVGGKNYWCFFVTVASAALGLLVLLLLVLFIFIEAMANPALLRTSPHFDSIRENGTWLVFLPLVPLETSQAGLLVLAFATFLLALVSFLLLGHLLGFHIYLLTRNMSTYDYVVKQRHTNAPREKLETAAQSASSKSVSVQHLPHVETTIDCDAPLPGKTSALRYQDKGQIAGPLSAAFCTEMDGLRQNPGNAVTSFPHLPKSHSQRLPGGVNADDAVFWRQGKDEWMAAQGFPRRVSGEGAPVAQNPLGSSVMKPMVDHQQQQMTLPPQELP